MTETTLGSLGVVSPRLYSSVALFATYERNLCPFTSLGYFYSRFLQHLISIRGVPSILGTSRVHNSLAIRLRERISFNLSHSHPRYSLLPLWHLFYMGSSASPFVLLYVECALLSAFWR